MTFSSELDALTEKYRKRMAYAAKTATLEVVNEARQPRSKGGRMPVDTSNLRNSMVAAIGTMPSGQTTGNENRVGDPVDAQIIKWVPRDKVFYAGFTAQYSRKMEYKYGFMRGAVMRWGEHVRKAANEALAKIP
jgi:hypothetical protein